MADGAGARQEPTRPSGLRPRGGFAQPPMQWSVAEPADPAAVQALARPPWPARDLTAAIVGLALPVLVFALFESALQSIDRPVPDVAAARVAYIMVAVMGFGGTAALCVLRRRQAGFVLAIGAAAALVVAPLMAMLAEGSYGSRSFGLFYASAGGGPGPLPVFVILWVAMLVPTLCLLSRPRRSATMGAVAGAVLLLSTAGAAVYHLITIEEQAVAAARAYESVPGLPVVLLAAVLAMLAWRRRRAPVHEGP